MHSKLIRAFIFILSAIMVLLLELSFWVLPPDTSFLHSVSGYAPVQTLRAASFTPVEVSRAGQELTTSGTVSQFMQNGPAEGNLFHFVFSVIFLLLISSLLLLSTFYQTVQRCGIPVLSCTRISHYLHRKDGKKRS
jgi:hypothetical protein